MKKRTFLALILCALFLSGCGALSLSVETPPIDTFEVSATTGLLRSYENYYSNTPCGKAILFFLLPDEFKEEIPGQNEYAAPNGATITISDAFPLSEKSTFMDAAQLEETLGPNAAERLASDTFSQNGVKVLHTYYTLEQGDGYEEAFIGWQKGVYHVETADALVELYTICPAEDEKALEDALFYQFTLQLDHSASYYPLQPMTQENEDYANRFIQSPLLYNTFKNAFDEETPPVLDVMYCYRYLNGAPNPISPEILWVPAQQVEERLQKHFPVTAQQLRTMAGAAYDSRRGAYRSGDGYGGLSPSPYVYKAEKAGDILTLYCRWYGMDDGVLLFENIVEVQNPDGDYFYLQNKLV